MVRGLRKVKHNEGVPRTAPPPKTSAQGEGKGAPPLGSGGPQTRKKKILLRCIVGASIVVGASWVVFTIKPTWWAQLKGHLPFHSAPCDYDGDGDTDIAVWRPSNGRWYIQGQSSALWGVSGDCPVPGDYDGDGTTEIGVWRPSNGKWYIQGYLSVPYGLSGDIPVPGDYDGDGDTDIAVWRPSSLTWYIQGQSSVAYGLSGDIPVPGDYDGDGDTDIAVWRPSSLTWYIQDLSSPQWGASGDIPLAQNIWIWKRTGLIP